MTWFKSKQEQLAENLQEEQAYALAAYEIANGEMRPGLWAKAFAEAAGNEQRAQGVYIKLRVLAATFILLTSTPVLAEWTEIVETARSTYYFDISTIKRNGDLRKVWVMVSLKSPANNGALSRRTLDEFDCKEEQSRSLSLEEFREDKLSGALIGRLGANPEGWIPIAPNTASKSMLEAICIRIK